MFKEILISARPKQWTKNLIIFAALVFSKNIFNPDLLIKAVIAFIDFCILSSGLYIINDFIDIKIDKNHPLKSKRPLALGTFKKEMALFISITMLVLGLFLAAILNYRYLSIAIMFVVINLAYSLCIKHMVILDVMTIALSFILRAVGGAEAISVAISGWLLVCTLLLALFLGFSKRLAEFNRHGENRRNLRKVLEHYSGVLLNQLITVTAASAITAYAIYTMSEETVSKFHTTNLKYTLPFVIYGIMRYMYIIHRKEGGEVPEDALLCDRMISLNILFYFLAVVIILYL